MRKKKRGVVRWTDPRKGSRSVRRAVSASVQQVPLVPGSLYVSDYRFEAVTDSRWGIPVLVAREKHVSDMLTVFVYVGPVRVADHTYSAGRVIHHVKHTFIMGGGRYIVDNLQFLHPAGDT